MASYLKKRGSNYYVQVAVPRPLQKIVGAAKIIRTTGTSDLRLAERAKFQLIADIKREIEMLEAAPQLNCQWQIDVMCSPDRGSLSVQLQVNPDVRRWT